MASILPRDEGRSCHCHLDGSSEQDQSDIVRNGAGVPGAIGTIIRYTITCKLLQLRNHFPVSRLELQLHRIAAGICFTIGHCFPQ